MGFLKLEGGYKNHGNKDTKNYEFLVKKWLKFDIVKFQSAGAVDDGS